MNDDDFKMLIMLLLSILDILLLILAIKSRIA